MKLSELIDRCPGADPELAVEDEHGIPRPIVGVDHGVTLVDGAPVTFVLLEPAGEDD